MGKADRQNDEQDRYARVLDFSAKAGFLGVVAAYFVYLFEILPARIPDAGMEKVWRLGPEYYRRVSGAKGGFDWVALLGFGDFFMLIPLVFLSSVTVLCYFSILPVFLRKKEFLFAGICVAEIIVLVFAATGWKTYSGH